MSTETENKVPTIEEERQELATQYPLVELFTTSDLNCLKTWIDRFIEFKGEDKVDVTNMRAVILGAIEDELVGIAKDMDLQEADVNAFFKEINLLVDEETAIKVRALIGRWINAAGWPKVLAFLKGVVKYIVYRGYDYKDSLSKKLFDKDITYDLDTMCAICLCWTMLIETSVCVQKEIQDNAHYMPETLAHVIFIDRLSRDFNRRENYGLGVVHGMKERQQFILRLIFNFFVEDINRFNDANQPHQSNIAYVSAARASFKRAGGDPSMFVYRCLDNGQNWSLFQFLTADE